MLRNKVLPALLCVGLGSAGGAHAQSVSYWMDQSNALADGVNYLKVTIDDEGVSGYINFTVEVQSALGSIAGSNFGIQAFGFNVVDGAALPPDSTTQPGAWVLPGGWTADITPPQNPSYDGFGVFDAALGDGGANRQAPTLQFSVLANGNSISDYLEGSLKSNGGVPAQGSMYFTAHVAGFDDGMGNTSAYFGGLTPVPLPPAILLLGSALLALGGVRRRRG